MSQVKKGFERMVSEQTVEALISNGGHLEGLSQVYWVAQCKEPQGGSYFVLHFRPIGDPTEEVEKDEFEGVRWLYKTLTIYRGDFAEDLRKKYGKMVDMIKIIEGVGPSNARAEIHIGGHSVLKIN